MLCHGRGVLGAGWHDGQSDGFGTNVFGGGFVGCDERGREEEGREGGEELHGGRYR